jgi:hypothetical protein
MDHDEIGAGKWRDGDSAVLFADFGEASPARTENVTLVLQLASRADGVLVTAKVLDKDDGGRVLYRRSLLDGPGSDAGVPGPPLDRWGPFVPDWGSPITHVQVVYAEVSEIAEGTPPPVEVVVDNLEYDLYDAPVLSAEKSILLSWPEHTAQGQIAVGAETVEGPWIPLPEPIFKKGGQLCVAVPITFAEHWLNPTEYFKLVPGGQLIDDFSGDKEPWVACYHGEGQFQYSYPEGAFRIQAPTPGSADRGVLGPPLPVAEIPIFADFSMSIDILDWDERADFQSLGFAARSTVQSEWPPADGICESGGSSYLGGIILRRAQPAILWYFLSTTLEEFRSQPFELDPDGVYRLAFSGVGNRLKVTLRDLGRSGWPVVAELPFIDGALSQGTIALWVNANYGQSRYDITVDNFIVTGTTPE